MTNLIPRLAGMDPKVEAARRAISAAGGPAGLARRLLPEGHAAGDHVRMQHRVSKWRINGVAARWVLAVAAATGVPASELAPDIYPSTVVVAA